MIGRLRKNFVLVSMGCVFFVLLLVMAVLNIASLSRFDQFNQRTLTMISENGGAYPKPPDNAQHPQFDSKVYSPRDMNLEARFQTRFFTVKLDNNGEVISTDIGQIAAISENDAVSMAKELFESGKVSGYKGYYKYLRSRTDNGYLYVFLDCTRDLYSVRSFFNISMAVFFISVILIFIPVFILSKRVIRPIAESYEKQKRFITDAGHEFKTPLAVISSCTEVLEMEDGENKWTQGIRAQISRLSKLTQSLISLAKMDEVEDMINREELSLSDTFKELLEPYEAFYDDGSREIRKDIGENILFCGDARLLEQLMSILIENAYKYAAPGEIRFSLSKKGRKIILETENKADGYAVGDHCELFDRFYRGDKSRSSDNPGYGIGLSMAQSIVQTHGGTIEARSLSPDTLTITVAL